MWAEEEAGRRQEVEAEGERRGGGGGGGDGERGGEEERAEWEEVWEEEEEEEAAEERRRGELGAWRRRKETGGRESYSALGCCEKVSGSRTAHGDEREAAWGERKRVAAPDVVSTPPLRTSDEVCERRGSCGPEVSEEQDECWQVLATAPFIGLSSRVSSWGFWGLGLQASPALRASQAAFPSAIPSKRGAHDAP